MSAPLSSSAPITGNRPRDFASNHPTMDSAVRGL
jgi:hypothetical protein